MNSYRDYTWDVVRGIGILMVVLGHCAPRPLVDFVYLFHMGLFFFVSGYFLKITDNGSFLENEKKYIKRKLRTLWLPFVIFTLFILGLQDFFVNHYMAEIRYPGLEGVKMAIMVLGFKQVDNSILCPIWFLKSLFFSCILVYTIMLWIRKEKFRLLFFVALYAMVTVLQNLHFPLPTAIFRELTVTFIIYMGFVACKYKVVQKWGGTVWLLLLSFLLLMMASKFIRIDVMSATFSYPLMFPLMTVIGIIFTYNLSRVIMKVLPKLSEILQYLGKNSLYILLLHVLGFKIVSVFLVWHYGLNADTSKNLYDMVIRDHVGDYWWIVYTLVGVIFSLGVMKLISLIKIKNKYYYKS